MLATPRDEIEHEHELTGKTRLQLSSADKAILKAMLNSAGRVTTTRLKEITRPSCINSAKKTKENRATTYHDGI